MPVNSLATPSTRSTTTWSECDRHADAVGLERHPIHLRTPCLQQVDTLRPKPVTRPPVTRMSSWRPLLSIPTPEPVPSMT